MNQDNRRLQEIQMQIKAYNTLLECSNCIEDSLNFQSKLEELETEEKEILQRCDVII